MHFVKVIESQHKIKWNNNDNTIKTSKTVTSKFNKKENWKKIKTKHI